MNPNADHQPTLSVVIPLYCESETIPRTLPVIQAVLDTLPLPYEIVLVDDGSPDATWQVVQQQRATASHMRAIRLSRNFGKEAALAAGIEGASGAAVIVMDADLQHPPELIPEMVRLWQEEQADVVEAVKQDRGKEPLLRKWGAGLFYDVLDRLSGYDLQRMSDYKLMDRQVIDAWLRMGERGIFFRGMIAWLGFRHRHVSFVVPERTGGTSRWSTLRLIRMAINAVTIFSSRPLHIVTFLGGLFFIAAILLGMQTLFMKLSGNAVSGFATVILLQLIIGSLLMISLGIIGIYLARIYEEVKGRPRYVIAEVVEQMSTHE